MDVDKEIRKIKLLVELECNLPFGTLDQKTRKAEVVMARILFANILMFDIGLKPAQLIKYIGKHRTNYYHYQKLHNSYMDNPKIHPLYYVNKKLDTNIFPTKVVCLQYGNKI